MQLFQFFYRCYIKADLISIQKFKFSLKIFNLKPHLTNLKMQNYELFKKPYQCQKFDCNLLVVLLNLISCYFLVIILQFVNILHCLKQLIKVGVSRLNAISYIVYSIVRNYFIPAT